MAKVAVLCSDNLSNSLLTWQGQGKYHTPMKSTSSLSSKARDDRSHCECRPGTLANPKRADDGRLMYFESQAQPRENYRGPFADMLDDEVRFILAEALSWSTISCPSSWPLPPAGLPGKANSKYDRYESAAMLLRIGMEYSHGAIRGEARTMHNRWQQARDFIGKMERNIEDRLRMELVQERIRLETQREVNTAAQVVYFIGASSGPIKIGISVHPRVRLASLQTSHHDKLSILATCDGGAARERSYHALFAARRLHGEWFERAPEILAEIERISSPRPCDIGDEDDG